MKEHFLNLYEHPGKRRLAASDKLFEQGIVHRKVGAPIDSQGLIDAGHKKKKPDAWVFQNIQDRIYAPIPRSIRDQQNLIWQLNVPTEPVTRENGNGGV